MTKGIHHITAIASNAQDTVDFYAKVLGLRLVKQTVNQDDTATYHLFFGDETGEPGMDLTFFIFLPSMQGKSGNGQVTKISLAVPDTSLNFWHKRLRSFDVKTTEIKSRFGLERITFFDQDGQQLELVAVQQDVLDKTAHVWTTKEITKKEAVRQFHSATLSVQNLASIEPVLIEVLGYTKIDEDGDVHLFRASSNSGRAELLEVSESQELETGLNAAGTVHHIAFRAQDEADLLEYRKRLLDIGLYPTEVVNRFYFKSVYFRTRAGILFEIATDGPGFTADEKSEELGTHLSLPPFLESQRSSIEANLTPLNYEPTF